MEETMDSCKFDKDKYTCKVCEKILREPLQLGCCGLRVCKSCETLIGECPSCSSLTNNNLFDDTSILKEMNGIDISCEDSSCFWHGTLSIYQDHLDEFHKSLYEEMVESKDDTFDQHVPHSYLEASISPSHNENSPLVPELLASKETIPFIEESPSDDTSQNGNEFHLLSSNENWYMAPDISLIDKDQVVPEVMQNGKCSLKSQYCGECGNKFLRDNYESHKIQCRGNMIHYHGPVYKKPNDISQETPWLPGDNELLLNSTSKNMLSSQYTISHKIEIALNGKALREFEAPFDVSDYLYHIESSMKDQLPIEIPELGKIHWKIAQVSHLLKHYETVLSPCFYSSQDGYKLRLQLDFALRQLHLLLVSGEYDSTLSWPFNQAINFGVLGFGPLSDVFAAFKCSPHCGRCYSSGKGNVAASVTLPENIFESDFVNKDVLLVNCSVSEH